MWGSPKGRPRAYVSLTYLGNGRNHLPQNSVKDTPVFREILARMGHFKASSDVVLPNKYTGTRSAPDQLQFVTRV